MELVHLRFTSFFSLIILFSFTRTSKGSPKVIDARGHGVSRGVYSEIVFANFKAHKFSYLNVTSLSTEYVVSSRECWFACVKAPSCFSLNVAACLNFSGKVLCELLPSDKYKNPHKFVGSEFFHHFSIWSPCINEPCQNGGTCITDYEKNSYVCLCEKGYIRWHCDTRSPINSTIIADNEFYVMKLKEFLPPAMENRPSLLCYGEFHSRCDGKSHTVTIIKNGQCVFGGYTDIPWEPPEPHGSFGSAPNAFIFSLRNNEELEPFKSVVAKPGSSAIYRDARYRPTFGNGWDLFIAPYANRYNDSYTKFGSYYPAAPSGVQDPLTVLAGTQYFSPDDWEVFYLGRLVLPSLLQRFHFLYIDSLLA